MNNSSIYIDGISLYVLILFVLLLFVIGIISIAGWVKSEECNENLYRRLESEQHKNRILNDCARRGTFLKSQSEINAWRDEDV